jgi:hypothetical protein
VVILSAEDGLADTIRVRIDRQGGDPARTFVLQAIRRKGVDVPFSLERDLPQLEAAIQRTQARVVRIDPVSAYLGQKDSYKDAEVRSVLAPLAALAERTRVAMIGIMHLTKDAQRRLIHRAGGSIAFVAAARTVFAVGLDPDDEAHQRRLLVLIKSNLGAAPPTLAFQIDADGLKWEPEAVSVAGDPESLLRTTGEPESVESRADLAEAKRFLATILADGPVASKAVEKAAKENGIAERTLWRAKRAMKVDAVRRPGEKYWTWFRP